MGGIYTRVGLVVRPVAKGVLRACAKSVSSVSPPFALAGSRERIASLLIDLPNLFDSVGVSPRILSFRLFVHSAAISLGRPGAWDLAGPGVRCS